MLKRARATVVAMAVLGILGLPAAVAADAQVRAADASLVSVGDFLLRYAQAMNLPLLEGADATEAVAQLQAQGVVLEEVDLERPLTEGDVVRFASRVGLRLRTLNADRVFSASRVDSFFDTFGDVLGGGDGALGTEACDPAKANCGEGSERAREKRKKKKVFESPPDP